MSQQSRARAAQRGAAPDDPTTFLVRWSVLLAGGVVVLAALAAYHNSFAGPFVMDDTLAITGNPTIRHFGSALSPPGSSTAGGRPVLNLTFAINYALNGTEVWGYHALNLLIHTLAGLTLFGIVRRTLLRQGYGGQALVRPVFSGRFGADAVPLALAVAVIWVVHPIQTEAVTYVSQRAESLMGLFYLLTVYCFIRGASAAGEGRETRGERPEGTALALGSQRSTLSSKLWFSSSVLFCFLGTLSKETIVTAPVMVLLYDRTFVAGSFREAWRLRWRYYSGLALSWLLLARLMVGLGQRSVGFGQGVTWWSYAMTSCRSVVMYLKLALWPHPLVFDYGANIVQHPTEIVPYALVLAAALAVTVIVLLRRPVIGFACAWFFVILAPTSSVVPIADQPMAEHRLYLSLAAVIALGVLGLHRLIGRRALIVGAAAAVGLGWLSVQRNQVYCSELILWSDTVAKRPDNARALYNLAYTLAKTPSRIPEAIANYEAALRIDPDSAETHDNLGSALLEVPGRLPDAIAEFEAALRIKPGLAEAHNNLGTALLKVPGRAPDAIAQFEAALRIKPDSMETHNNLGHALLDVPGRVPDAIDQFEAALRIDPDSAETHYNLGNALLNAPGRVPDAIAEFEAALRLNPDSADAHINLGNLLLNIPGRASDAMAHFEAALRINPDSAVAHSNLGTALSNLPERLPDAIAQFEAALRINPDSAETHYNLGNAFLKVPGRLPDAIVEFEAAVRLNPDSVEAHYNLGNALLEVPGRLPDAMAQLKAALRLKPDLAPAREILDRLQNQTGLEGN
jgi:tetratricopeptide (TPR) repeat protein